MDEPSDSNSTSTDRTWLHIVLPAHVIFVHNSAPPDSQATGSRQSDMLEYESASAIADVESARKLWSPMFNVTVAAPWPGAVLGKDVASSDIFGVVHMHPPDGQSPLDNKVKVTVSSLLEPSSPPIPRLRLCLELPGDTAANHLDYLVNAPEPATLAFPGLEPEGDLKIRLLSIASSWRFARVLSSGNEDLAIEDPWTESPRALPLKTTLREIDSGTELGSIVNRSGLQGIAYAGRVGTAALAVRFSKELGRSRSLVFKAVQGIEGNCEALNSWDGPKISWGICQWTAGLGTWFDGELAQILAFVKDKYPDAFRRLFESYGLRLVADRPTSMWSSSGTYPRVKIYRVPCCGPKVQQAMNSTSDDEIANILRMKREESASYAMHWILASAGADSDIQRAQAQWLSLRLSSISPTGKTIREATDAFLRSLAPGMPNQTSQEIEKMHQDRLKIAMNNLEGTESNEKFSDEHAEPAWVSWSA